MAQQRCYDAADAVSQFLETIEARQALFNALHAYRQISSESHLQEVNHAIARRLEIPLPDTREPFKADNENVQITKDLTLNDVLEAGHTACKTQMDTTKARALLTRLFTPRQVADKVAYLHTFQYQTSTIGRQSFTTDLTAESLYQRDHYHRLVYGHILADQEERVSSELETPNAELERELSRLKRQGYMRENAPEWEQVNSLLTARIFGSPKSRTMFREDKRRLLEAMRVGKQLRAVTHVLGIGALAQLHNLKVDKLPKLETIMDILDAVKRLSGLATLVKGDEAELTPLQHLFREFSVEDENVEDDNVEQEIVEEETVEDDTVEENLIEFSDDE